MRRTLGIIFIALAILVVTIIGFVVFTVTTPYSAETVRIWFDAVGGVISAAAAVVVALLGFRSQREQAREAADVQRLQGREAAEASRIATAEAAEQARTLEQQRFQHELQLERERAQQNEKLAIAVSRNQDRRQAYAGLIGWAYSRVNYLPADPESQQSIYGGTLALASDEIRAALETFETADDGARFAAYEDLVRAIRRELGSDEPIDTAAGESPHKTTER